jgi:hypothetical protein
MGLALRLVTLATVIGCAAWSVRKPDTARARTARQVQFHLTCDDPTGIYRIDLVHDHDDRVDDDVHIDFTGRQMTLDHAFLDNALPTFHHNGRVIGTVANPATPMASHSLRVRVVKSTHDEIWYYVGSDDQFAQLRQQMLEGGAISL